MYDAAVGSCVGGRATPFSVIVICINIIFNIRHEFIISLALFYWHRLELGARCCDVDERCDRNKLICNMYALIYGAQPF